MIVVDVDVDINANDEFVRCRSEAGRSSTVDGYGFTFIRDYGVVVVVQAPSRCYSTFLVKLVPCGSRLNCRPGFWQKEDEEL